jgi:gluconolactonase
MRSRYVVSGTSFIPLRLVLLALPAIAAVVVAQGQPADAKRTPGVQAGQDPNRAAFIAANCKNPVTPSPGRAGGPAPATPAAPAAGRGAATPAATQDYTVTAIPGVIAANQRWRVIWEDAGNNADGILGLDDGSLLIAQNDRSQVVRLDREARASVVYTNTYTGGALAANARGQIFIAERALSPAIWLLAPERRLFANAYNGEPLDCLGPGVLNDMAADSKGGVYFTMGGVYYANPRGVITGRYGTVGGNGIILSPDERTLYVTGRVGGGPPPAGTTGGLVAFDVQADGALTNERQFAEVGGDGSAVDAEGRIYTTGGGVVSVVSRDGALLGRIPAPRNLISVAFGGPDKKTLFAVAIRDAQAMSIPMIAQGFRGRPK